MSEVIDAASVMAQLHADRSGHRVIPSIKKAQPDPRQLAVAEREREALALPDELFAGDARLQQLRAALAVREAARARSRAIRMELEDAQVKLRRYVAEAERELQWAVIAAVINKDHTFSQARELASDLEEDCALLRAIGRTIKQVAAMPNSPHIMENEISTARTNVGAHLNDLKRARVAAQLHKENHHGND